MTSEEALKRLLCMAKKGCKADMCNVKYVENASDIVKKDLEVLKMLKNYIDFYTCRDTDGQSCINIVIPESVKNYTIIKEWLDHD